MRAKIGKAIISLALLSGIISPYIALFVSIYFFLIGLFILWSSKTKKISKLLWTFAPIIMWFPLMLCWLFVYNSISEMLAQKIDCFVHESFTGTFQIVESPCGIDPIIKNGRSQIEIPSNGVYFFNGDLNNSHFNNRVYIRYDSGHIIELPTPPRTKEVVYKDTTGNERIIGCFDATFGKRYYSNNQVSNFISVTLETNKEYRYNEIHNIKRKQDKYVHDFLRNCDN